MEDTMEREQESIDELREKLTRTTSLLNALIDLLEVREIVSRSDMMAALENYNLNSSAPVSERIKALAQEEAGRLRRMRLYSK